MSAAIGLYFGNGAAGDAEELAALHTEVAEHLTSRHGRGPWSRATSAKGVLFAMRHSQVVVARDGTEIVAALQLTTRKPWAIDTSYFTRCDKPLYLLAMAVSPKRQRIGIGRRCVEEAKRRAAAWPADAIRLDAFDADAGAGRFYERCGFFEAGRISYRGAPLIYYELVVG